MAFIISLFVHSRFFFLCLAEGCQYRIRNSYQAAAAEKLRFSNIPLCLCPVLWAALKELFP